MARPWPSNKRVRDFSEEELTQLRDEVGSHRPGTPWANSQTTGADNVARLAYLGANPRLSRHIT